MNQEQVHRLDLSAYGTAGSDVSVRDAVRCLREQGHLSLLIIDGGELRGIFTDLDVLYKVVDRPECWGDPVSTVMTANVRTIGPEATLARAIDVMYEHSVRNLPVVGEDGHVLGNLTYRSIILFLADRFPEKIYNLPPNPDLKARRRAGA